MLFNNFWFSLKKFDSKIYIDKNIKVLNREREKVLNREREVFELKTEKLVHKTF